MINPTPKQIAIKAAREAGAVLIKQFKTLSHTAIQTKSKHEIVTPADLASEKIILKYIKKHFPDHAILSEESGKSGNKKSEYLWIIDPLDGTTNFAMGNPLFSVSIALAKNNKIILGVIYVPYLDNMYIAETGKPSTLNSKPIKVSTENKISHAFLTFCHGNSNEAIKQAINIYKKLKFNTRDLRQVGSAAIELCWVAQGKTEAMIVPGVYAWDVAAGTLIVRNAGGKITGMLGNNWNLQANGIIASNKKINQNLIKQIKKIK